MGCGGSKGDVGKDEVGKRRGELKVCWDPTHFPRSPPFPSPHSFPTRQHTFSLTPYTLPHPPHTSPLPTHLSLPPPTPQHISLHLPHTSLPTAPLTSPYTPTHFLIHPIHSPTPVPTCYPTVSIMWQSYHVTMLP